MVSEHWRGCFPHPAILAVCICLALAVPAAASPTTELHVVRYAADGVTVLEETTVDYRWLETNLPVQGDGLTHYYHQGPVFEREWERVHPGEPYDPWNPGEDVNVEEKDMGAVKGTDLADICDLVGGMREGETVRVRAADGMSKTFPYRNVYEPEPRQGPIVVTWYRADEGYVPGYYTGMRLVFFADTSTNPNGTHAFGVWDMHECFDPNDWYFFQPELPTTTGLSVQYVSDVIIYSDEEPTGNIYVHSTPSGAAVFIDDEETGDVTPCTLSGIEPGTYKIRVEKEGFVQPDDVWVSVEANAVSDVEFNLTPETRPGGGSGGSGTPAADAEINQTAETGSIAVSSVPTNASILLDGNATGLFTDATLDAVPVGEHTIKLVLPGYRNVTRTVIVEKGEYSFLDLVLSSTEDGVANATEDEQNSPHPWFTVLGPFEFRGRLEIVRTNVSTTPNGTAMDNHLTGAAWGRWYLYTANTSAGAPAFDDAAPGRRYTDGVSETWAVNVTPGNKTTVMHCLPGACNGSHLLAVRTDENASAVTCWIGEGVLAPGSPHLARFEGTLDPARAGAARLTIVGGGNTSVAFNGHAVTPLPRELPGDSLGVTEYDVLPYLNASANKVHLRTDGDAIRNVILIVTAGDEPREETPAPAPANPLEAFFAGILDLLSGIFPFFGSGGEAPDEPEQNSTPEPNSDPVTPVPEETSASTVTAPGAGEDIARAGHSGGLYIESYPPGMTIVIDNKRLVWQTPHTVYGLREGLHTIMVEKGKQGGSKEESGYRFETVQAWVYPDAITPVFLDSLVTRQKKSIEIDSEAYRGEKFTVNGVFPAGTIPGDAEIEGAQSWITVSRNGTYLSYRIPYTIRTDETYTVEPWGGGTVPVSIGSDPAGAAVFIDGFPTGKVTPCRVDGLSPGQHRILISKPGYIPAGDVITIPEGAETGGAIACTLREYVSGDLLVESTVPDAKIYLYGRYTGEKTPHAFAGMSIGTYEVRAVSENDSRTIEDVLVAPGQTTRCVVSLKERDA